jgi:hypothetical protein
LRIKWSALHEEYDFAFSDPFFYDFLSVFIGELNLGLFLEVRIT